MNDEDRKKKEVNVGVFSRAASKYDRFGPRFFSHFGRRLVELAQIAPGTKVLDVAAGRGAVLFPAAASVGPSGHVIGIDLSADMVRETAAEIEGAGLQHAVVRQMDAEQLNFPDVSFDCVLCAFALWMFPQPGRALQEFFRVLRPGGSIGLTTWAEDSPFQTWYHGSLRPYIGTHTARAPNRFDTPARLEAALKGAEFAHIRVIVEERDFVYSNEEEFWSSLWTHGTRIPLEKLSAPVLDQAKSYLCQKVQVFKQPDGIHIPPLRVLFASGTKPVH